MDLSKFSVFSFFFFKNIADKKKIKLDFETHKLSMC